MKTEIANFKLRVLKHVSNIIKSGEGIPPVMYVRTNKGKFKIMPIHPQLMADKRLRDKCREAMQYMLKVANADLLCFVSEAYVSAINADTLKPAQKKRMEDGELNKADYEKITNVKKECLFLSFEAKTISKDNNELMTFEIKDKQLMPHKVLGISSGPDENFSGSIQNGGGTFSNLFEVS